MAIKLLSKVAKKAPYVVPPGLLEKANKGETLVHVQKPVKKKPVQMTANVPVQPSVQTTANPSTGKAEVTLTLPLKTETAAYLGVEHEGKVIWLAKQSLARFSISNGSARFTMTRQQASRRGLLQKAAAEVKAA